VVRAKAPFAPMFLLGGVFFFACVAGLAALLLSRRVRRRDRYRCRESSRRSRGSARSCRLSNAGPVRTRFTIKRFHGAPPGDVAFPWPTELVGGCRTAAAGPGPGAGGRGPGRGAARTAGVPASSRPGPWPAGGAITVTG
jgi:hypothetical protein